MLLTFSIIPITFFSQFNQILDIIYSYYTIRKRHSINQNGRIMSYQAVFKRYEIKYLLTKEQKCAVLEAMEGHMSIDKYGRTIIRNIYYDTDNFRLIRRSLEKPMYKEKLRIRSYGRAGKEDKVFVELKKKYDGIVYKRRLSMNEDVAREWIIGEIPQPVSGQISDEIDYVSKFYGLKPKAFISYEREAYFSDEDEEFRVTFDENITCRTTDLHLDTEVYGDVILGDGLTLMEIKTPGGIPLWMTSVLTENKIYKTSFSKYGKAYTDIISA